MRNLIRPLNALNTVSAHGRKPSSWRRPLALLLSFLLYTQAIVHPSIASSFTPFGGGTNVAGPLTSRSATDGNTTPAAAPATESFGVVLTALSTAFNGHAGVDYQQHSRSLVVSAGSPTGLPNNFELIDDDGTHRAFSNIGGLGGALKIATARDDGQGASLGGFRAGELFTGTGVPGELARVAPDGAMVQSPWVTLGGESGTTGGLHVDRTGAFGGDLIVVTDAGGVWRVNSSGVAARVASLDTPLAGVTIIPDDAARYGPWAGKILAGARERGAVYAVDAQGDAASFQLGVSPEDIAVVPAHENFFGIDPADAKLWGAPADAFTRLIGDVLVAQGSPGVLTRVRWNGTDFETGRLAQVAGWGQITFAPAGVAEVRGVKQVYDKLAVVRHAPVINSGRVEGALWQLSAENVVLDGTDVITSDLLVPGTPDVSVGGGQTNFGGVIEGVEGSQPSGYTFSIGGNASLRHLITRTDPLELEQVSRPSAPAGARDVSVTGAGQDLGDLSTLRDLSLSGKAGAVSVPPGTYGSFSLGGRTTLVLGAENATEPAVYNLQALSLAGGSELRLAGPVVLTVRGDVSLTGSTVGAADDPRRLLLRVAEGGVRVGGGGVLYGVVRAPGGAVEIAGQGRVRGTVTCDRLTVNGNGVLQVTENDVPLPPVNRPPAADAGADQTITLPTDSVNLGGTVTDDGLPAGATLTTLWTKLSGPGAVTFADASNATTTASFSSPGTYVLRLRASDSLLTNDDEMTVNVLRRPNRPPQITSSPVLEFTPGSATSGGGETVGLAPWTVQQFGAGVWQMSPAQGVYAYDVEATDPDGDALTYSLDAAPQGMTIDPANGLINWPVTPREAGRHNVVVRVRDPDGESDTQGYTLTIIDPAGGAAFKVYTLNGDFDQGSYINVTREVPDQLQLNETARTLNFIWVAVSTKGTVVKIDTETGAVLGEYFTSPSGQPRNPSRTTVDQNGNVWASNRDGNTVLHIGLVENGQCVDRNNNGTIETSTGYSDIRPWTNAGGADTFGGVSTAQDECIIHYTKVNSFGTRHVSVTKDNDVWVSGTGGQRFDLIDGKTGLIKRSEPSVGYGGYGGLIDKAGVIWSARPLLRWDTANPLTGPNGGNWRGYGHDSYGLCIDSKGNVWNTSFSPHIHKFAPDGTLLGTFNHGSTGAQGCVVDKNDDVWVAHSLFLYTVGHLKNTGAFVGNITVGPGPTGVAVDAKGKVWAAMYGGQSVARIDPALGPVGADGVTPVGAVDLTTRDLGGGLYNYSDMTGSTLSGAPDQGTWSTVFDSGRAASEWGRVGWTARVCGDGLLTVSVATGEDGTSFGQPVVVSNGEDPVLPAGRYARVSVKFQRASSGESPVLYDISVGTAGYALETPADLAPVVDAGPDQTLEGVTKTTLRGTACDDGLPSNQRLALSWSKVSGPGAVTFARAGSAATEVTFGVPGTYELKLTAGNSASNGSDTVVVEVLPGNEPPTVNAGPDRTITHPDAAALEGAVTDDGLPRGGTLLVTWGKVSGPGGVTFAAPNAASTTARFGAPGVYVLRLTASDTEFARHDEMTVTVGGENQRPVVSAGPDRTITLPNTAALDGTATDDGWPEGSTLAVTWTLVSGPGAAAFDSPNRPTAVASFGEAGTYVLRLTADDSALSASDEVTVTVEPAAPLPLVAITSPADGSRIHDRTVINGSVSGGPWRLEYSLNGPAGAADRVWTAFASGNSPAEGPLGTLDPTTLLNGSYTVRLVAANAAGQTSAASFSALVAGELKVGNFTLSFADLGVPVAGIPIGVTRTYDSRDKRRGDFGVGWSLGLKNVRVEKSGPLGGDWQQTVSGTFFPTYCLGSTRPSFVTITFPDDTVYAFETTLNPQCQALAPVQYTNVRFTQLPGDANTQGATLTAVGGGDTVFYTGSAPGVGDLVSDETLDLYDPTRFQLTTADGTVLVVDEADGLRSLRDTNGNTLLVNPDGIIHSSGKSITFTRDAQNRITRITDPAGHNLDYAYDANGDLVSTSDQSGRTTRYAYNSTHGLLNITDPMNRRGIRNEYDAFGRLVSVTDEEGKTVRFRFDPNSRQQVITDRKGNITVYEFDESGNTLSITDAEGKVTRATYDQAGNRLTQTDQFGNTTTFTYDARGNVLSRTDAQNRGTHFTYDARNRVTSMTDANGNTTANAYDANGNLTSTTDAAGNTTTFTYNSGGQPLTLTDAAGHTSSFEYDPSGNMTKETDRNGNVTRHGYDALGNRTSVTDPRGNTTRFNYDDSGLLTATIDALGNVTRRGYDAVGNISESIDALGRRQSFSSNFRGMPLQTTNADGTQFNLKYDANGLLAGSSATGGLDPSLDRNGVNLPTKLTVAPGVAFAFQYDAAGRTSAQTDPLGNTTSFQYNLLNKVTSKSDALGSEVRYGYDAVGNLVNATDPNGNTISHTYDKANRRVRSTLPDGTFYENTYDSLGEVTARRDAMGHVSSYAYDDEGRLISTTQPGGGVTRYAYDPNGNLISSTDAGGRRTLFEYDRLNRLVKKTFPDATTELVAYDAAGMVTSTTDRKGNATAFEYDSMSRPSLVRYADGKTVAYTYTPTGQRDTVTDARGVTDFDYDAQDRLTRVRYPDGTAVGYAYDLAGNRTGITTPDGTTSYGYDKGNRLVKVTDPRGLVTSYTYDALGNLLSINHPNGLTTSKTYDRVSRLMSVKTTKPNGDTVFQETYTRDAGGKRTGVTQADGSAVVYAYDAQSRLTGETYRDAGGNVLRQVGYTYDSVGNRLTMTEGPAGTTVNYTYNTSDQLTSDGAATFVYDSNGNTVSENRAGAVTGYDYDALDRMTRVTRPDGSVLSYGYDADGNRVRSADAGGAVTNYVVDLTSNTPQVLVEMDDAGNVVASYTYGIGLISQRRDGADSFYIHDALGSTRALTDAGGAVTDSYSYDAFGRLSASSGTTVNPFLFTGEQHDAATGLYYLRARYYNPSAGRFTTADPYDGESADPLSQHKYAYVRNNPVNKTDPTGMYDKDEGNSAHQEIGRFYIELYGDFFVDILSYEPNKGFNVQTLPNWYGLGAYNRAVRSGKRSGPRPDLRHYGNGDVYEIKPMTILGLISAMIEVRDYIQDLNQRESGRAHGKRWRLGRESFWPVVPLSDGFGLTEAYAFPCTPEGTVLYTNNLERDLLNLSAARSAMALSRRSVIGVRMVLKLAPRIAQRAAEMKLAEIETERAVAQRMAMAA